MAKDVTFQKALKRIFDIEVAAMGLLSLSLLLVITSILIKITSKGSVFYMAERIGINKKLFKMYKFRSMIVGADKIGSYVTQGNDNRFTKIGRLLRKSKIDELPQLINVLKGDMSFVGPRPEVVSEVENYPVELDIIFTVRPGITDLASIHFRNHEEIIQNSGLSDPKLAFRTLIQPKKLELQKKYLAEHTIWLDLKILLQTISVIFFK